MQIRVSASHNGLTASAIITQMNVVGANVGGGLSTTAKVLIVVAVAAGAAAGVIVATHGGGSSSTASITNSITITPGTPSVGAPH